MLFNLSDAWAQSAESRTAEGQIEIKPLQIGDTIPEEVWNMPLQTVKHGRETKEIRLADYRGKVIILDYWATWCKSCINAMPKMHRLAIAYPDDVILLPVTHESTAVVKKFLEVTASKQIKSLEGIFHTVVDGNMLKDIVPHQTLPHIAIINGEGVLEQITKPPYLSEEVLGQIVEKQDYYIPTYRASLDTTLLSPTFNDIRQYEPYYYSTVTGCVDGFMFPHGKLRDTLAGIQKGHYINFPILQLFNTANPTGLALLPSRRLFLMDNPIALEYHYKRNPHYNDRRFSYSYEYVLPLSIDPDEVRQRMWNDLNMFTGYRAQIVKMEIPCLVLKEVRDDYKIERSDDTTKMMYVLNGITQERVPRDFGRSKDGFLSYMRGVTVKGMVWNLNRMTEGSLPFIIDETGIDHNINIGFPDNIFDCDALIETLRKQGISAVIEKRNLDMFVIADKSVGDVELKDMPIKLTKIGYVMGKEVGDE